MARVTLQMGHCFRTRGATGTRREQEFVSALAPKIAWRLRALGHEVHVRGADEAVPVCDVFVALHTDGSLDPSRRGASVGYPDDGGRRLAAAWKRAHQRMGYSGGFHADNYTAALRGYYGYRLAPGARHRFLAEHGTTTNAEDERWLFDHLEECAVAHVQAIGEIVGHPKAPPTPNPKEDDVIYVVHRMDRPDDDVAEAYLLAGGQLTFISAGRDVEELRRAGVKELKLSAELVDRMPRNPGS